MAQYIQIMTKQNPLDFLLNTDSVNSLKHFLQILQNIEFTDAKFLLCLHVITEILIVHV
jgi:hypothetical protein